MTMRIWRGMPCEMWFTLLGQELCITGTARQLAGWKLKSMDGNIFRTPSPSTAILSMPGHLLQQFEPFSLWCVLNILFRDRVL
jgi:hypothetical protein